MLMPAIRRIVTAAQGFIDDMSESQRNVILKVGLYDAAMSSLFVILGICI